MNGSITLHEPWAVLVTGNAVFVGNSTTGTVAHLPVPAQPEKKDAKGKQQQLPPDVIRGARISADGRYLVVGGDNKVMRVYELLPSGEIKHVGDRFFPKKISCLAFAPDSRIVAADKTGDVHVATPPALSDCTVLLGHFSILTDLSFFPDAIVTADSDNKIRISDYPRAYNVQAFCLGTPKSFVSCVTTAIQGSRRLILSGGSPAAVTVWDTQGKALQVVELAAAAAAEEKTGGNPALQRPPYVSALVYEGKTSTVAVAVAGSSSVRLFSLTAAPALEAKGELQLGNGVEATGLAFSSSSALWVSTSSRTEPLVVFARKQGGSYEKATDVPLLSAFTKAVSELPAQKGQIISLAEEVARQKQQSRQRAEEFKKKLAEKEEKRRARKAQKKAAGTSAADAEPESEEEELEEEDDGDEGDE